MTQQLANLFQRAATVKHPCSQGVSKLMSSMGRRPHSGAFNGISDNAGDHG